MTRGRVVALVVIVVLVLLVVAAWSVLRGGFSAREKPSKVEEFLARRMRDLATPSAVKNLPNPQQATPENIREALEHFADHCAVCHANNGSGDTMFGRNMYPKPPDLRAEPTQKLTDGEIYSIIQNGVRLTGMPAFGQPNRTDDTSSWNLVHFIRHLPKLSAEEEAEMKRLNPKSPLEAREQQEADEFLEGDKAEKKPTKQPHKH
jgi:mono/diheme cytochrome c family protein